ncbi:AAA family ATPase [Rhizobium laguerreae]|uniref:AAA family ATPase n=1 Tax=Rhizobium laguerreae TaxID=1076926 RepID=UPI001C9297F3|nr:AAA family ATPase [Rhizobium laguerreae]MBY3503584.1 AAA family ATPase [Rhizobium laguerreae]MBY3576167.1 AAA family ATPase [Rhizobium laguerreae]
MIKLETAHIEEFRGIRKLDIDFGRKTFAISGPNGSGKSGVIDAIEFGLTGEIGRLTGRGTKGLSVAEHGPHVDKVKFPDAAFVELKVFITELGKSATIIRKVASPGRPKIVPDDPDVRAALADIADHPEITLARRDILRFILIEPSKRSEEIQTILKLEDIGQARSALNTAQNKLQAASKSAANLVQSGRDTLQRHLQISVFGAGELLASVNAKREALGLGKIESMTPETRLDAGLSDGDKQPEFNKQSVLRDLRATAEAMGGLASLGKEDAEAVLSCIATLEGDPSLLIALQRRSLVEKGLDLVDSPSCPLCDHAWPDEEHLLSHLKTKLAKSEEAGKLQASLLKSGTEIAGHAEGLMGLLRQTLKIAKAEGETGCAEFVTAWGLDIQELKGQLSGVDGLIGLKDRLKDDWPRMPAALPAKVAALEAKIEAKPDQSATIAAQTFLTTAQLRLDDYRDAMRKNEAAKLATDAAKAAYDAYCRCMEDELNALYSDVQDDFSKFYRLINEDDEAKFTAKLTPSEGKLDFDVNFYERGLFPPGAYHSEGHQDGMGVCLYLALMKRVFGKHFTVALLDDVVMSVDSGHRYQFCKLLKTHFPDTQFVITTHDRLWAEQMKSAGLVTTKSSLAFHSWTVDTGPLVESSSDIWEEIDAALAKGKVETAAHGLRHHLEYASRHLADQLGASPVFRADGNYELGELLPSVLSRVKEIYGKAVDSAQSWSNTTTKEAALSRKAALSSSNGASNVEQWAVNKAVHYNEWGNFGRKDFEPVVAAFKELLDCLQCKDCQSWLYISPRGSRPESLRCQCNGVNFNLKTKPK